MTSFPVNLPTQLQQEAQRWATNQGISLEQFIIWAIAEKVGTLSQPVDDPQFPGITYRCGASGTRVPILLGTGLRVQSVAIASQQWGLSVSQIAAEYNLSEAQVNEALAFYAAHRQEIDRAIAAEQAFESYNV
ncbi:DUF433 domain-containing protein [Fischerella thermalis CCMEE 5198]|jgi:uncharacterized protein (DUF433 family)|uniref:DUF433 domain-containing protein n=1 Tax=Fischerella TaxID=1190 RepID=UPI00072294B4|nr:MULTISPECIES: DUF433 domain-containing protein [Fischerella]PMB06864.1 DUF433 domain-containing protein [Fischerella thermalis CCMEE 5196]PMB23923.1 DUF433 domain-containing protein [Fischerella thermalis CCMEE 5198]PMB49778.1 DUF433 domain-containing protein [Fischerella thermalis CCMEE 5201]BAU08522.1 hypothetical protein FIS3754_44700 [Fischerella sp. NIES-3754]